MFEKILDLIFPDTCFYCGKLGKIICNDCLKKINIPYLFKKLNNEDFDYVFCGSYYKNEIRNMIHSFKFHKKAYLYKYFIKLCLRDKKIYEFLRKFDCITYVPMHYKKQIKRGYNQSELLAKELGKRLDLPVLKCLEKIKENKVQSLLSEKERVQNVKGVYKICGSIDIKGKNIILVDDILTTGSTAKSCSKILKTCKPKTICVFSIAKT